VFERSDWQAQAACRGVDVNIFFPGLGESTWAAKALCGTCPVAEPCRAYAMGDTTSTGCGAAPANGSARR
jgi:hypothetical protein